MARIAGGREGHPGGEGGGAPEGLRNAREIIVRANIEVERRKMSWSIENILGGG